VHWRDVISGRSRGLGPSLVRAALHVASLPYRVIIKSRNWLFDHGWKKTLSVSIPVVSVGNLTVGGTGKTPTVAMLAQWFRARGIRVAIVSRGYGAGADGRNDEARELETKLDDVPHLQDPDRYAAATVASEELEMQVIVLDDGFQHRRLARNLDIVLLDASDPFGQGYLLPRGLLRESPRSLRRAHVVMLTRCDLVSAQRLADIRTQVQRIAPRVAWVETEHRPVQIKNASDERRSIESLQGLKCFVFSGIGNPSAFIETARRCGADIVASQTFPDHHAFTASDIQNLAETIRSNPAIEAVLCTGKDLAKIGVPTLGEVPLWMVEIELIVRSGMEALEDRLNTIVESIPQE
jgi:tetraacyldisaccharide 4'-kinase